jgi:hypothetical protein
MRAAVFCRVAEAACGVGTADFARLGQIIIDVLITEGVDLRHGCSLEEVKELLQAAVRAAKQSNVRIPVVVDASLTASGSRTV